MTSRSIFGLAILAAAFAATAALAVAKQATPRDTATLGSTSTSGSAAPAGTGVLGGVVTSEDGAQPVRFAAVMLIGATTGVVKVSSSDGEGLFRFTGLPADRYTVGASKRPYLGAIAGAGRPGRPGTPIALADGQRIANVAVRMPMGAAIGGVVTDERGRAGLNVSVALQQWRMQGTERVLVPTGSSTAVDDRGRYRFFGLAPGEYVVVATSFGVPQAARTLTLAEVDNALRPGAPSAAPAAFAAPSAAPPPAAIRYAPVYFPGTSRLNDAQPIVLAVGESRENVDMRLTTVTTSRVDGAVMTADGQPAGAVRVLLSSASEAFRGGTAIRTLPDGRFSFNIVAPGSYTATVNGEGPLMGQFAALPVEVAGADVSGVQLTMRPALTFSGRLVFVGATNAPALAGRRVPIRAVGAGAASAPVPAIAPTNPSGIFTATNILPGRYVLGGPLVFGLTADFSTWALQSVMVDGRDVADLPIDIVDTAPKDVTVIYGDRWQELSVHLRSRSGEPAVGYTVVLFPEDKSYWLFGSRRIATARPGTDGRATLSGPGPTTVPPGRYLLAAVTAIDRDEQFDPAFLAALMPAAVPITLQPGDRTVQELAIR